eukprot:jgi/Bigna1/65114/fgenesh1_kg.98_\
MTALSKKFLHSPTPVVALLKHFGDQVLMPASSVSATIPYRFSFRLFHSSTC